MDIKKALEVLNLSAIIQNNKTNLSDIKGEAKTNYRDLCMVHHPDKGGDAEKFKEISSALKIINELSDLTELQQKLTQSQQNKFEFPKNIGMIFNRAYTNLPTHAAVSAHLTSNVFYSLNVNTTELYTGTAKSISVKRNLKQGNQIQSTFTNYIIKILPGSYHGQTIEIKGGGNQNLMGFFSDLIIVLNEMNDTKFTREKQNLIYYADVTLRDALLGGALSLVHPSGNPMTVKYRLKNPYDKIVLKGKGMPIYGTESYGDLHIEFNVKFPKNVPGHMLVDLDGVLSVLEYSSTE